MREATRRDSGRARAWRAVAWCAVALVAAASGRAQRWPLQVFTADDGLPASQIWTILQDHRGLLWVGTSWGLTRYDGRSFSTLSVTEGLPSPTVRSLVEDAAGALWIGTNAGLARYDGRRITPIPPAEVPEEAVWAATLDTYGHAWFGTEVGLYVRLGDGFRRFGTGDGLPGAYVYALLAASDGALWVGTRGEGLARCVPSAQGELGECRSWSTANGLPSDVVRAFAEDRSGRILIGTRGGGVVVWDGERVTPHPANDLLPSADVYALRVLAEGTIVIGTSEDGLAMCLEGVPARCRILSQQQGLPENGIHALYEDQEETLWIGTEAGLIRSGSQSTWRYSEADGLPDRQVYSLLPDGDDALWIGTYDGLAHLELGPHGELDSRVVDRALLPGRWIWALERDRDGGLWVGTEDGLCRFEGAGCRAIGLVDGMPARDALALTLDARGDLWAGTTTGVAQIRIEPDAVRVARFYGREDGLPATRAYGILADGEGRIWVAHSVALSWFDGERFHAVEADSGLPAHTVRGLGLGRDGALLAGGYEHISRRIAGTDPPRFRSWGREAGLQEVLVLTAAELASGRLLLGTNRGILVLDPEAAGGTGAVVGRWDHRRGLAGAEVPHAESFARGPAGRLWFGLKSGLVGFREELFEESPPPPVVEFVGLSSGRGRNFRTPFTALGGEPVGWIGPDPPELPHDDTEVRLEVRAVSLAHAAGLLFQFRLQGDGREWTEERPEAFRDITNLVPGRHVVEVRARRAGGEWGPPAQMAFVVRPAWWQTPAFRIGSALLAIGLLLAAIRWRARSLERRTRELERQVAERTDDLERYAQALVEHLQTIDRSGELERRGIRARRELLARTSHELRTPLTAILGFSDLLERALAEKLPERERRYLANVRDGGEHLLRLVNNLLDQLKLEAGRMETHLEEVALDAMVESVISLMEGFALHRGVRLEWRAEPGLPPVRADVAKLRQVLLNLLSNAVKFSPPGQAVVLAARTAASHELADAEAGYELAVEDRGPGIAPEEIESVFEPYRQLASGDPIAPGTGLGLSIARQLVELLGGVIRVESTLGSGSTFRVVLPVDPESVRSRAEKGQKTSEIRPRLLLVEPDRAAFQALAQRLGRDQLLAVRASDSADAERMLPELRPAALAVRADPADPVAWKRFEEVGRLAARSRVPLSLLVMDSEGLGVALSLDLVVAVEDPSDAARVVLETFAPVRRGSDAAPTLLVAAERDPGVGFASAVRRSGAEAFRVEGEAAVLAACAEAPGDLLVLDLAHLLRLAPEVGGGRTSPAIAFGRPKVLLAGGVPDPVDLARLRSRLRAEGGEAGLALVGSARAMLERAELRTPALGAAS